MSPTKKKTPRKRVVSGWAYFHGETLAVVKLKWNRGEWHDPRSGVPCTIHYTLPITNQKSKRIGV